MTSSKPNLKLLPAIQLKCKRCSRPISPTEAKLFGTYLGTDFSGRYCIDCRLTFSYDLAVLEEHINAEDQGQRCDSCHDDLTTIAARQNGKPQMYLHIKDNILQFLCFKCSANYSAKATNLYKSTLWGWNNKLL